METKRYQVYEELVGGSNYYIGVFHNYDDAYRCLMECRENDPDGWYVLD